MIHHVTLEVETRHIQAESEFWGLLGFQRTMIPPRHQRKVYWLVDPNANQAIHLHIVPDAPGALKLDLSHLAIIRDDFDRTCKQLIDNGFGSASHAESYHGHRRAFIESPAGHTVELMEGAPSVRAGMPLEETI